MYSTGQKMYTHSIFVLNIKKNCLRWNCIKVKTLCNFVYCWWYCRIKYKIGGKRHCYSWNWSHPTHISRYNLPVWDCQLLCLTSMSDTILFRVFFFGAIWEMIILPILALSLFSEMESMCESIGDAAPSEQWLQLSIAALLEISEISFWKYFESN